MAIKLNGNYVKRFISDDEIKAYQPMVDAADKMLRERTGSGSEMTDWVELPNNYDKEEYSRILSYAKEIRGKCDVLPVAIVNKHRRMKFFTKNYVIIGKPIKYEELGITDGDKAQFEAASKVIFDRICDMCDEYREKILR